jgi:hypothetical protein
MTYGATLSCLAVENDAAGADVSVLHTGQITLSF